MKPRHLAEAMIQEMRKAAERVWEEQGEQLEVDNKEEGKKWVWQHVKVYFSK